MGSAPDGQVLAAGTNPNGGTLSLYYSGDEGSSWTILPIPNNPAPTIQDVVLSSDGQIYLADLAYGVFYSDNYGQTWTDIGEFTPEGCASFGLHSSGVIFAGLTYTGIGYIHRSENNGQPGKLFHCLIIIPTMLLSIYNSTPRGIYSLGPLMVCIVLRTWGKPGNSAMLT